MFVSDELKSHLETSATVKLKSLVTAEWNMNMPDNIYLLGNYRYRPLEDESIYYTIPNSFDNLDQGNYYTGATDADVVVDNGVTDSNTPQQFVLPKEKMKTIYSLEDCIKPFRPRSGVNKAIFFNNKYLANSGSAMAERPRYYMASRYDQFKYWTSYRTENNIERGIAKNIVNSLYYIDDTAPFVIYKNQVPANRLVVKMQTNVGNVNLGPYNTKDGLIEDPLFGESNKTVPTRWKIQYLFKNNWIDAISFDENSIREDGTPIIGTDGYVELQYGLIVPNDYKNIFIFKDTISSTALLPISPNIGDSYLLIENTGDLGTFYIYTENGYQTFTPTYEWYLGSEEVNPETSFVTDFTLPSGFTNTVSGSIQYREFQYLQGIRVVAQTMNKFDSTFDLIEMSPRLVADISDKVIDFRISKVLSDIGITSLPVGQLLASTGSMNIFDDDQAFNSNNGGSIINKYVQKNIKFTFYEIISNVGEDANTYHVPIKTLYSEGMPQANVTSGTLSLNLRDFFFFLESMPAPQLLLTQTSLSVAITTMLDFVGYTNYSFKRLAGETDPIIPYFFVAPDQNVAEVLNQLAISTQTAMFFDEYNNLIVMSKSYLMPNESERETSFVLSGSNNQTDTGVVENSSSGNLPNILSVSSQDRKVYNDGQIVYTTRYIKRSYGSIREANLVDRDKTWIYEPSLLWEVSGDEPTKTINELASKQGSYILGAMPLNSDLSANLPSVSNGIVINNVIDFGENIWMVTRFQGYLYSSGEIIKYDAVQFNVTLGIWYPILANGLLDTSSPQIILPGKSVPIEVENQFDIDLQNQVKAGQITEQQKPFEKEALILNWLNTHRDGGSNVWISNNQEYQKYFSSLPFNGKIYPTGLIRIYSEPYYETVDGITRLQPGPVYQHGRGQFGTPVLAHTAGIDSYWTHPDNVRGCDMEATGYLFSTSFSGPTQINNVSSFGNTLYVSTVNGVNPNCIVTIIEGTGQLATTSDTTISTVNTSLASATITNVSASSGTVTYTANNTFSPGQTISITGVNPSSYNLSNVEVVTATTSSFTVSNSATGAYVSGGIAKSNVYTITVNPSPTVALSEAIIEISQVPKTEVGPAGIQNELAEQTSRSGIIKNFMATSYLTETSINRLKSTQSGTIQSSALVMTGPSFRTTENPLDFISYVPKNLNNAYKHFGTRMRVIGKIENNETRVQTPIGSTSYYQVNGTKPDQSVNIGGGSGGIAVLLNPETNNGYYFEIAALTETSLDSYLKTDNQGNSEVNLNNVIFYKIKKDSTNNNAIPIKLWGGLASIIVDNGLFTGQYRMTGEELPTVYDLSVEYQDIGQIRRFYLYINNRLIRIVDDEDPLPIYNNMALFVRGSSKCMFEHIYALSENYAQNSVFTVGETLSSAFGDKEIDANESFRKYAMSGIIQSTYLSGVGSQQPPKYSLYFDEFGTIFRECAYFDIRYDRAYPALYATISPTFNRIKGYTISGFQADSYGAEFLIFNATDTALNLDETSGNYLRIQGIAFTQDTTYTLTVDDYFAKTSNLSNPPLQGNRLLYSPFVEKEKYDNIKISRMIYGKNEFSINAPYIQTQDDANALMGWLINKVMVPKKNVGLEIFALPTLQLGDLVTIDYKNNDGVNLITPEDQRFVIYNMEYSRSNQGPSMTLYLSEV